MAASGRESAKHGFKPAMATNAVVPTVTFPPEVYRSAPLAASADEWLARGLDLLGWLRLRIAGLRFGEVFPLAKSFNPPGEAYGYFDEAIVGGEIMPAMGVVQSMAFDAGKGVAAGRLCAELREFVLHYFMRVSSFERPEAVASRKRGERAGFGYSQHWCRRGGKVWAFPTGTQYRIVDLRRLSTEFDWLITRVDLFNFLFRLQAFDPPFPYVEVPLPESTFLLLHRSFITDDPSSGRFGFGYVLLRNPEPGSFLAWGPGEFDLAVKLIDFRCVPDGSIQACASFAVNRPRRILRLPVDPLMSASDAAACLTGGHWPARSLEISFLEQHFHQHFAMLHGASTTWSQVDSWLRPERLPDWVRSGVLE